MGFRHRMRVRFNECDPQGVVFNANFLMYADIAITELYREAFGSWEMPMTEHGIDMVVAEANVRYLAPLRFDEEFDLVVELTRIGDTSTTTEVTMEPTGKPAAVVTVRHVIVDPATRAKAPIPQPVKEALAPYAREQPG